MPSIAPGIFRAYDIRGIVGDDLDADAARLAGRAFGTVIRREGGSRVAVGRDARPSSPELFGAFSDGIRATGCTVVDIGRVPTPVLYFALHHLEVDGGGVVTASHNPSEYNGLKLCVGTASLHGEGIQALLRLIQEGDLEEAGDDGIGGLEETDMVGPYLAMIKERISLTRPLRIVVDAGNGMGGELAPRLYRELGCDVTELYCEIDGTFPNHHPDPTVEKNVAELRVQVRSGDYDIGLGFDGDADRLGVIDETGEIIWGDKVTILLARDLLERNPGAAVIYDVKCSKLLGDDIRAHGGRPVMWKTGHSLIKQKMRDESALLAGEMSGHLFFGERFFGHDDAIYAGAKLLEILSRSDDSISSMLAGLPQTFSTPEIRRESSEEVKFEACSRLREELAAQHDVFDIDGVRVEFADGWGLARPSNTGPVIVLRFEAESPERLEEIRTMVEGRLAEIEAELTGATGD